MWKFVILFMSAGQFLASTFHKITLMTILWLPSQRDVMGCRLQQHCTGLLLLSPKAVVNLVVIAAIHPSGAAAAYSMEVVQG